MTCKHLAISILSRLIAKEGDTYTISLKLNEEVDPFDKEIKIDLRRMDKDFDEIRNKISVFAFEYDIQERAHKKSWL